MHNLPLTGIYKCIFAQLLVLCPILNPCQLLPPLVLVGFRVRCEEGVLRLGVGLDEASDSDFNERGNNLAGGRKWAQHRHTHGFYKYENFLAYAN